MANLTVDIHDRQVNRLFSRLLNKTGNLRPAMKAVGEVVYASVMENFKNESDPGGNKWHALAERTLKVKRHDHILFETGNLMRSIHIKATNRSVSIGTNVEYSRAMQFGDAINRIPARPYLGVKKRDWKEIKATLSDYILRG